MQFRSYLGSAIGFRSVVWRFRGPQCGGVSGFEAPLAGADLVLNGCQVVLALDDVGEDLVAVGLEEVQLPARWSAPDRSRAGTSRRSVTRSAWFRARSKP